MILKRKYFIVVCFFLAYGCFNGTPKKSSAEIKPQPEAQVKSVAVEFSIQGMSCTGCEQTIQSGISGIKGVKQVKANYKTGRAYVEFVPDLADTSRMKEVITSSGYVVARIKSIPMDSLRSKL